MAEGSVLWRRLDAPGHDACTIVRNDTGWKLCGSAVFQDDQVPAQLTYKVVCDAAWRTLEGQVDGWLGERRVSFSIVRTTEFWKVNDLVVPNLESCMDLDLGFTPATNLLPLRRLVLTEGQAADAPAVWLDVSSGTLTLLPQRYERRSTTTYWYEAPTNNYAATLEIASIGFVLLYPGLWKAEAIHDPTSA